jgi:formylglycine-generating enzyme required for sulfatase activity
LKKPNAWGLYDVSGNVWEWCQDWYAGNYRNANKTDPAGPSRGSEKVLRGGSWYWNAKCFRVSYRYNYEPDYGDYSGGFRCVLDFPTP